MSSVDDAISRSEMCANCGKGEENAGDLKACTGCKLVKYCNRDCQIAHRSQHKKQCKKRAAELHDKALFQIPPKRDECPICLVIMPFTNQQILQLCCGKVVCNGCNYTAYLSAGNPFNYPCPFCKSLHSGGGVDGKYYLTMIEKLVDLNNDKAMFQLGNDYMKGHPNVLTIHRNEKKAIELWSRSADLGNGDAHNHLADCYNNGKGVEQDMKKATKHMQTAAMKGNNFARHNLGVDEQRAGNINRSLKHFMIAAKTGFEESLESIKQGYMRGYITKDEYAETIRAYQASHDEMMSEEREAAVNNQKDKAKVLVDAMMLKMRKSK